MLLRNNQRSKTSGRAVSAARYYSKNGICQKWTRGRASTRQTTFQTNALLSDHLFSLSKPSGQKSKPICGATPLRPNKLNMIIKSILLVLIELPPALLSTLAEHGLIPNNHLTKICDYIHSFPLKIHKNANLFVADSPEEIQNEWQQLPNSAQHFGWWK